MLRDDLEGWDGEGGREEDMCIIHIHQEAEAVCVHVADSQCWAADTWPSYYIPIKKEKRRIHNLGCEGKCGLESPLDTAPVTSRVVVYMCGVV